jgi:EAL domain-containing protein (putative c-di-GMP-specific phosphodiesterase class I)
MSNFASEISEIINIIVHVTASPGMRLIAERIERKDQLATIAKPGCEYGQGPYFSKAVTWKGPEPDPGVGRPEAALELVPIPA